MRVPLSWLKEYVDLPVSPEALAQQLTLAGLEVEAIDYVGVAAPSDSPWAPDLTSPEPPEFFPWDPERILVGELLEVKQHPNADRLTIPVVGYGDGRSIEVVTGAPNIRPGMQGDKVVLALGGARLIDGHAATRQWITLKPSKLRGVRSEGMVCSELELGLSEEHEGILMLPPDAPVGMPLRDYLGDIVFDIALTTNLSRALSIVGVAREVAAITGGQLHLPTPHAHATGPSIEGRVTTAIETPELCSRMTLGLIEGIQVGPSPIWMQRRLLLAGMRPISNVVDVSNYVMLEWGQPTHAFDADRVTDQHLIVRLAEEGERLLTLDKQERILSHERLLIADRRGALSVAGVMGGYESEVSSTTTRVLLEAASWNPITIRKTAQALRLPSEASRRFERGVDPELPPLVQQRCLQLMQQVAGGTVAQGIVDVYPQPFVPPVLDLTATEVERLLGVQLSPQAIAACLDRLGFTTMITGSSVHVHVPSYRLDVTIPADLVEEVARIYGYHNVPETRLRAELPVQYTDTMLAGEGVVKDILAASGLYEVISYSLTNTQAVEAWEGRAIDATDYLHLANPLTTERSILRRSIAPELLQIAAADLNQRPTIRLFETGRVFEPNPPELLPKELRRLVIVLAGPRAQAAWLGPDTDLLDFFDLKGIIENLLARLRIEGVEWTRVEDSRFHPGRSARLKAHQGDPSQPLGICGELHPDTRNRIGFTVGRVCLAGLDLDALLALRQPVHFQPLHNQPAVFQDLAVIAPVEVEAARIQQVIATHAGPLLESILLFDQYSGAPIPPGQRSLAFRLTFRAADRTLSDSDVNKIRERIAQRLSSELGATVRGEA